jgi:hypothetical protein
VRGQAFRHLCSLRSSTRLHVHFGRDRGAFVRVLGLTAGLGSGGSPVTSSNSRGPGGQRGERGSVRRIAGTGAMMNGRMYMLVSLLALASALSCGTSKADMDAATTDHISEVCQDSRERGELHDPADAEAAKCSNLDQVACEASDACMAIEGWAKPQACLVWGDDPAGGSSEFVACVEATLCGAAFTWARPADSEDDVWLFPSTCIPTGWNTVDEAQCCQPDCKGKECGDDGCGGNCGLCGQGGQCQNAKCAYPHWTDPTSSLTWENPPSGGGLNDWSTAKSYCQDLDLSGYTDWRLPTIGELRTLIRGCPGTVTGGACKVTDSCLSDSCFDTGSCFSCPNVNGPADGCYWPAEMQGTCNWYWSSSLVENLDNLVWNVGFFGGFLNYGYVDYDDGHVRCVR